MEKKETQKGFDVLDPHFAELAGRKPVTVWYNQHPLCPKCGDMLELQFLKPHWFPYQHVDMMLICPMCSEEYLFGIPQSRDAGLSLITWDTNPFAVMRMFEEMQPGPTCRYKKHGKMIPTKIFGDWFENYTDTIRFQWKCPVCYMVCQVTRDRTVPHGDVDPLTDEEKEILLKRLEDMGYLG